LPDFRVPLIKILEINNTIANINSSTKPLVFKRIYSDQHPVFHVIDIFCNIWFTIEFVIRLIVSPKKKDFLKNATNMIDFFATLFYYIEFILRTVVIEKIKEEKISDNYIGVNLIEFLSIVRIFRFIKLTRHSAGLKILIHTFKASMKELSLLIFFLILFVIIFASLIFHAEKLDANQDSNQFQSIIDGLWWSIVTMTTVGYGNLLIKFIIH
jgi:potassium voltage-gated channel Shaw-related subfamily C protein 1